MEETAKQGQWQWQEAGTSWKGVGIYHLTLTVTSREPLLGTLVIPSNDPAQARVERTELGRAVLDCQLSVPVFYPEIQILQYCLMPDHLHSIWYVRRPMEKSIRYVAQGFWRGAKKAGRAYTYLTTRLQGGQTNETTAAGFFTGATANGSAAGILTGATANGSVAGILTGATANGSTAESSLCIRLSLSSLVPANSRENLLRQLLDSDTYSHLAPIFTEMPFIRPMSRRGQLQAMIRYVQLNPQRLATKRLYPGYFRVQEGIEIAGRTYAAVGNMALLQAASYAPVHVRQTMVDAAAHGDTQPLRNYMNGCVLAARRGTVMVSPFISSKEKEVKAVLLAEQHPFIVLADNGFRDYYKPSGDIFDAVAAGRVLILSPWEYDANKRHISRADCVALNVMAEQIAAMS